MTTPEQQPVENEAPLPNAPDEPTAVPTEEPTEEPTTPPPPPPKMALCIDRPFDPASLTIKQLLDLPCRLVDRKICDAKPATAEALSTLQILPYIAMVDLTKGEPRYFFYTRGAKGEEGRLHGKLSMGIGGHMEDKPEFNGSNAFEFARLIAHGAIREIEEEIGIEMPVNDFGNALIKGMYMPCKHGEGDLVADWIKVIYAPVTEVDSLHIAVCFAARLSPEDIGILEAGVITKGEWMTYDEVKGRNDVSLETWTDIYLETLNESWKRSARNEKLYIDPSIPEPTEAPTVAPVEEVQEVSDSDVDTMPPGVI